VRSFKLVVAYDGSGFHGWQIQPVARTVQGVLEEALKAVLDDPTLRLEGAGRTDAGVHARGQAASFQSKTRLPARALAPLLNPRLPPDVRVRSAEEVVPGFGARRCAVARRYAYRLLRDDDLLLGRFAWHPPRAFDPERLERATRTLEGEHDFSAFRSAGSSPSVPVCRVTRAGWTREEHGVRLDIAADHFLYHMVRNIVGTALAGVQTRDPAAAMREVLGSQDRSRAGVTAPACGLCLEEVFFAAGGAQ
jgi:tRNA pseudouridine38-40 synthase